MVIADFSGNFLNAENSQNNDLGVVLTEGRYEEKKNFKGEFYDQFVMDIEVNGKKMTHNPKTMEGKELVKVWGKDSKTWIGKTFTVKHYDQIVMGKPKVVVQIIPITQ
jgi:hypothetical protein